MISGEHSTWLEIDRAAIRSNVRRLVDIAGTRLMAVVKANAYGHGLVEVANTAVEAGAEWLGVARVEEAMILRAASIKAPILVLGFFPPESIPAAAEAGIRVCVYDRSIAEIYKSQWRPELPKLKVHLKVDSGMGRLGFMPTEVLDFTAWAASQRAFQVEGIFTHFARADEPEVNTTGSQLKVFLDICSSLSAAGLRPALSHAANSAATLTIPEARLDLVRCGIALYGLQPSPQCALPPGFSPAIRWITSLVSVKNLPAGFGVGYGHEYVTRTDERIGVLPVGYADGLRRKVPNHVLIRGCKLPVFPRVCMDQALFNLDPLPQAQIGDEVILVGQQDGQQITIEEIASNWKTNNYEVVSGLAARLPRRYIN